MPPFKLIAATGRRRSATAGRRPGLLRLSWIKLKCLLSFRESESDVPATQCDIGTAGVPLPVTVVVGRRWRHRDCRSLKVSFSAASLSSVTSTDSG